MNDKVVKNNRICYHQATDLLNSINKFDFNALYSDGTFKCKIALKIKSESVFYVEKHIESDWFPVFVSFVP